LNTSVQFTKPLAILQDTIDYYYFIEIITSEISIMQLNQYQVHIANGCVEMIIAYKDSSFKMHEDDQNLKQHQSFFYGPRALDNLAKSTGYTSTFRGTVVKFSFHGFYKIFKLPLSELYNGNYETDEVFGNKIRSLQDKLENASNNSERANYLDSFFKKQLGDNTNKDIKLERCLEAYKVINRFKGNIKLSRLMVHLSICERTLERDFMTVAGIVPKDLCRIVRLNNVIDTLYNEVSIKWSQIVIDNCYYDQAHMIKEFKKATLVTPEWFFKNKKSIVFKNSNQIIFPTTNQLNDLQFENIITATTDGYKTFLNNKI
jgi:AraC-like DNA-binding protein